MLLLQMVRMSRLYYLMFQKKNSLKGEFLYIRIYCNVGKCVSLLLHNERKGGWGWTRKCLSIQI